MGLFSSSPTKDELRGIKTVRICGSKFKIRKVNPLLDFPADSMPQVFTYFRSRRKAEPDQSPPVERQKKVIKEMQQVVAAGMVEPSLVPVGQGDNNGKEPGITVEDLFRDPRIGFGLYEAVLFHSLGRLKGLKGLFFSITTRLWLLMQRRNATGGYPAT